MKNGKEFAPPGPLGFGGAPLGNMFEEVSEAHSEATLVAAWDAGIRYFDTAPHYGSGLAEARAAGYDSMRLDTSKRQDEAMRLYERSGFRRIAPYYALPDDMKNWLVFFELTL